MTQASRISLLFLTLVSLTSEAAAQEAITAASANFGTYTGQTDTPGKLNCNLGWGANLGLNHTGLFTSSGYKLGVSLDANFGGIGTGLTITNTGNGTSVNVVENRSGAGAAWQTSYYLYDQSSDTFVIFNQAAGNNVPSQWGYSNSVANLTEANWVPMFSTSYTTNYSNPDGGTTVATTPCNNTGFEFDQGRGEINVTPLETSSGLVAHITNNFDVKSNENQAWTWEDAEQALYLSMSVASSNNLRIYLIGPNWTEGPLLPSAPFTIQHAVSQCTPSGCSNFINSAFSYMLLVWNVGGQDFGLAITNQGLDAQIDNSFTTYCSNASNPSCGSIDIHNWVSRQNNVSIPTGEVRSFRNEYYAGTLPQLAALGFSPGGTPAPPYYYPDFGNSGCAATTNAATNNQLAADPVSNLVSGSGFYSSTMFTSSFNSNSTYVSVVSGGSISGHIELDARLLNGQAEAFPSQYYLYVQETNLGGWINLGLYNTQPNAAGVVDMPFGWPTSMSSFEIIPTVLGVDNYNNHYLQLAGLKGCN